MPDLEARAQEAFTVNQQIGNNEQRRRALFAENVVLLSRMHDERLFRLLIGEDARWSAYLAQIENYYTRAQVERWRKILNRFVNEFRIDLGSQLDIPETRLENVAKYATNNEHAIQLLDQARVLTSTDWNNLIRQLRGRPTSDDCDHTTMGVFRICQRCGFRQHQNIQTPTQTEESR